MQSHTPMYAVKANHQPGPAMPAVEAGLWVNQEPSYPYFAIAQTTAAMRPATNSGSSTPLSLSNHTHTPPRTIGTDTAAMTRYQRFSEPPSCVWNAIASTDASKIAK